MRVSCIAVKRPRRLEQYPAFNPARGLVVGYSPDTPPRAPATASQRHPKDSRNRECHDPNRGASSSRPRAIHAPIRPPRPADQHRFRTHFRAGLPPQARSRVLRAVGGRGRACVRWHPHRQSQPHPQTSTTHRIGDRSLKPVARAGTVAQNEGESREAPEDDKTDPGNQARAHSSR